MDTLDLSDYQAIRLQLVWYGSAVGVRKHGREIASVLGESVESIKAITR